MKKNEAYRNLCITAMEVVDEAASFVRDQHEKRKDLNIEIKGRHNFVTDVDKKTEEILVKGLRRVLPEAGFIAEEGTDTTRGKTYNWVIDPVDGTTNFIHGVYPFAISVGLIEDELPVAGIIHEFGLKETFYGWKDGGAWLRNGQEDVPDRQIHVSRVPSVELSLLATGFPYTDFSYLDEFIESVSFFMENSQGLRRLGSAAADMAYVACGRFDGFYEYGLHPWDIAAGILLIREAGGRLSDFDGNDNPLFREDIICSNGHIQDEFLQTIRKIMMKK